MSSLPLLAAPPPSSLVGIARLAAMGESLSEGHLVEYFSLPTRSLLNRCTSRRMPFTWTINPYRGCEFACKYCYARYTHEFMELREGVDFERKIYVKTPQGAEPGPFSEHQEARVEDFGGRSIGDQLRRDLRRVKRGEDIALGTATDPYQPAERRFRITQSILEELARHQGLELGIVTKSNMVLRDLPVLKRVAEHNRLVVNMTITTTDVALARILEPRAPRPDLRMEAVRELNRAGISAGVICAPVLPGITDSMANLESVVKGAAEAGARHVYANPLFLKSCSANVFLPFLQKEFPQLVEQYRKRYSEQAFVSAAYRKRIAALMMSLRKKYGIERPRWETKPELEAAEPEPGTSQLSLF